ncbi:MAG: ABC transporter permease [Anaerolineae bacterium]|nr:ABC transporter permease [Anaerolineae bacterium]
MKAFAKMFTASLKEFARDRTAFFWTLAFPILFMLLFGAIFGGGDSTQIQVGLVVEDQGSAGEGLAQAFSNVPVIKLYRGDRETELAALKTGKRGVVVVLPAGLSQSIGSGQTGQVEVYYDPSQQMSTQFRLAVVQQVLEHTERHVTGNTPMFSMTPKTIQAERMRNIDFLVPGILGMALMQLGIMATSQPLIALRQNQVLRRLGTTPLPRTTVLTSQVTLRVLIAVAQAALIVLVARLVFNVQMTGSWLVLLGVVLFGGLTFVSIGYLIAAVARTEESGMAIAQIINFPMMFLSGIFFPVEVMPKFLKPVVTAMPLTYLGDALRQTMVGASALHPLTLDIAVLGAWLLVCLALAVRFFRWE